MKNLFSAIAMNYNHICNFSNVKWLKLEKKFFLNTRLFVWIFSKKNQFKSKILLNGAIEIRPSISKSPFREVLMFWKFSYAKLPLC